MCGVSWVDVHRCNDTPRRTPAQLIPSKSSTFLDANIKVKSASKTHIKVLNKKRSKIAGATGETSAVDGPPNFKGSLLPPTNVVHNQSEISANKDPLKRSKGGVKGVDHLSSHNCNNHS